MGFEDAMKGAFGTEITEQTQSTEVKTETTETASQATFDISSLNSYFGTNFENEDQFKSVLSLQDILKQKDEELGKYKTGFEEYQSKLTENEKKLQELSQPVDVKALFANEELYKVNELAKKYPGKDASIIQKIISTDESTANPFELLVLNELNSNPKIKGGEKGARELVADRYGIDLEDVASLDKLPDLTVNKLERDANKVRDEFRTLKSIETSSLDLPRIKEESQQKAKEQYEAKVKIANPVAKKLIDNFKQFEVNDSVDGNVETLFKYDVVWKDGLKEAIEQQVTNYLASVDSVDETVALNARNLMTSLYEQANRADMWKHYRTQMQTQYKDDRHKELHNDSDLSDKQRTSTDKDWVANFISGFKK